MKVFTKIIILLILTALIRLAFGLGADAFASFSFFMDTEPAPASHIQTAVLDFSLHADSDFEPVLTPTIPVIKKINIVNDGNLALFYGLNIVNAGSSLCGVLDLEASLNGIQVYQGSLNNFNMSNVNLGTSSIDKLVLTATLNDSNASWQNQVCAFDLYVYGEQNNQTGFSDHEEISNSIHSGTWDYTADHILITKVYYDVDLAHGRESENEWVEIYNPTATATDISLWPLCNHNICTNMPAGTILAPGQFAVVTRFDSTWDYWDPAPDVLRIAQVGFPGVYYSNTAEMVMLRNNSGEVVDQMNYGETDPDWLYYNSHVWQPGLELIPEGHLFARLPVGQDTDQPEDWTALSLPEVNVINPNGGEVWWVGRDASIEWSAVNPNGDDDALLIDLYYSNDSGKTWALIATSTENDGHQEFRLPLFLENGSYWVPSATARVKVVAIGPENPMAQNYDKSDADFCPPIDYSLLTEEEIIYLKNHGLYITPEENSEHSSELVDLSQELSSEVFNISEKDADKEANLDGFSSPDLASSSEDQASSSDDMQTEPAEQASSSEMDMSDTDDTDSSSTPDIIQEETSDPEISEASDPEQVIIMDEPITTNLPIIKILTQIQLSSPTTTPESIED